MSTKKIPIGKGSIIKDGTDVAILSFGHPGNLVISAQNEFKKLGINVGHYNMRFVKPLDNKLLHNILQKYSKIITIEDGCVSGGFGSAVLEFISEHNYSVKVEMLGIPDRFINHGSQEELYNECSYDEKSIIKTVKKMVTPSAVTQAG